MNGANYDREMIKVIKEVGEGKKLLLHSCCAPCSSSCIERLVPFFDLTIYYYNPNIDGVEEFNKRAKEQQRLCEEFNLPCVIEEYNFNEFYSFVKGFEDALEGGERCRKCFYLRLKKTAEYAKAHGYDFFTTTLTVSPLKNADVLNEIGLKVASEVGVKFLPCDFKKRGGYQRSIELSKEYQLYRQNYCGCVFSKRGNP